MAADLLGFTQWRALFGRWMLVLFGPGLPRRHAAFSFASRCAASSELHAMDAGER